MYRLILSSSPWTGVFSRIRQRWHPGMNILAYRGKHLRNFSAWSELPCPDARKAEAQLQTGVLTTAQFCSLHVMSDRMSTPPARSGHVQD